MKILAVKLKSVIITIIVILIVVFGIFMTAHTLSDAVSGEARMIPIYNVETDEKKVAITFNCAVGNSDMDSILTTLDKYNVRATFFLLGLWADDYIEEVQKIYDAGHEIGNHGYSHKDLPTMNYENILLDIQKCNETIRNITGHSPTLLRPPSGAYDNKTISAAENLGMMTIQWDVDSLDWKNISADEIVTRVMTKVGNGSIIQFHTGTEHTAQALPEILSLLSGQGYSFVSVGELIYYDNFTIDHNGTQKKQSRVKF
ncbi:MAG: polysaccharide deacetylase family protein [Clostridia bacterium]|nr:polysaccharide deacetylase family protein [Clostridia bacterium]